MKVKLTVRELFDNNVWMEYCALTGTNDWAVNEGLMSDDEEVYLTEDQAVVLGLVKMTSAYYRRKEEEKRQQTPFVKILKSLDEKYPGIENLADDIERDIRQELNEEGIKIVDYLFNNNEESSSHVVFHSKMLIGTIWI